MKRCPLIIAALWLIAMSHLGGATQADDTTITITATFDDPCGYEHPTVLQPRTDSTDLSFDYILIKGSCSDFTPAILDTDSALRWVGTAGVATISGAFFDNAAYISEGNGLVRID